MIKKFFSLLIISVFLTNSSFANKKTYSCNTNVEALSQIVETNWKESPYVGYFSQIIDATTGNPYVGAVQSRYKTSLPKDKNPHLKFIMIRSEKVGNSWVFTCYYRINNREIREGLFDILHLVYRNYDPITFCYPKNLSTVECLD